MKEGFRLDTVSGEAQRRSPSAMYCILFTKEERNRAEVGEHSLVGRETRKKKKKTHAHDAYHPWTFTLLYEHLVDSQRCTCLSRV